MNISAKIIDESTKNEIIRRILKVTSVEKIVFFGSHIYGAPHEGSDIDIIVVKSAIGSRIEEYKKIRKSLRGIDYPFDLIIITPEEFNFYSSNWKNSIIAEAAIKGEILYERN